MRPFAFIGLLVSFLILTHSACAELDLTGAPEMPKGYESKEALEKDLFSGKIPIIQAAGLETPEGLEIKKGIEVKKTEQKDLKLDLYFNPSKKTPSPLLVFIHGGGWKGGKPSDYHYYCLKFAALDYTVATITYRFSQEAKYPAAVEDVVDAIKWLRSHAEEYGIDPNRIALIGGSAGGHLSMLVGYTWKDLAADGKSPIKAVVDLYGPTDLTTDFAINTKVVIDFIGKPYDQAAESYKEASPLFQLDANDPPTLVFQGTIDDIVPVEQSDILVEKLKELGIPHHYEKFEGWPHTMDLAQPVNDRCRFVIEKFLAEYL